MVKGGKFIMMDTQINKDSFTEQRRDTSATATAGGLAAPARSTSSDCSTLLVDHLAKGNTNVDTPSEGILKATGSCGNEILTLRDGAISQEDSGLEELREGLKETLRTITRKRTVASEVTAGVKEAALILTQLLVHRKGWKDAQRKLAATELKEREHLVQQLQRREQLLREARQTETPSKKNEKVSEQMEVEHSSPPKGPEESIVLTYSEATTRGNTPCKNEATKGKRPLASPEEGEREQKKRKEKETVDKKSGDAVFIVVEGKRKKRNRKKKEKAAKTAGNGEQGPGQDGTTNGPATERTTAPKETKQRKMRQRAEAVLISPGESRSSGDVLKALRSKLSLEDLTTSVRSIRTARNGGLLIEFEGSVKDHSALDKRITEAAGGVVAVRHLVPTTTVVIDGLDAATTVDEVRATLRQSINEGADELKVNITKPNKWGAVRAFIEARCAVATALEALGKVKVGWLVCRIRRWERLDRCFRCHGLGHSAGSCKVKVDRSSLCWRCGQADHQAKACPNPPRCHLCAAVGDGRSVDHTIGSRRCTSHKNG
ncbi:uncharacterized protein LOC130671149 [Microplitis mediator]|uniref:uncharacterized protein LOC130671149 n=1 Tax=Microplitis mediator TaxID=375433 RepID=UPI00255397C8|nr:uncharacterized protein LOC130671149 [Microplitis mediator]